MQLLSESEIFFLAFTSSVFVFFDNRVYDLWICIYGCATYSTTKKLSAGTNLGILFLFIVRFSSLKCFICLLVLLRLSVHCFQIAF